MPVLRTCMGNSSMKDVIRYNRLHWCGHLQRMGVEKWPRKMLNFEANVSYPRSHAKKRHSLDTLVNYMTF